MSAAGVIINGANKVFWFFFHLFYHKSISVLIVWIETVAGFTPGTGLRCNKACAPQKQIVSHLLAGGQVPVGQHC